jgi:hypothetical protein
MRDSRIRPIVVYLIAVISGVFAAASSAPGQDVRKISTSAALNPEQLIRDTVYNELHDHEVHGYWQYMVHKKTANDLMSLEQVETKSGPVQRLIAVNGEPLTPQRRHDEDVRLEEFLSDSAKQRKVREQYLDDEKRIARIMQLLPIAFSYQYEGIEGDNYCLSFRPNPAFHPPTIEARVFHAMQGKVYVNARWKRLARLDGRLMDNIDFGYGLLGRMNKGGWFNLERTRANETDWKTEMLEIHVSGRAVLFKTIAKDTREERFGFREVPRNITLSDAKRMLDSQYTVAREVGSQRSALR